MLIGIDASRANLPHKTGTEWYAYHLIQNFKKIADPQDQFILYSKEKLIGDLGILPKNFSSKILKWPPKFLWTQLRLAWEMLWHKPDILFVPAHTIPVFHPSKTITTLHDVGFEHDAKLYSTNKIGPPGSLLQKILGICVKIATLGKYGSSVLDYHRWAARFALKHAQTIITVSHFSKHEILRYYSANPEKIKVIYHGISDAYKKITDSKKITYGLKQLHIDSPFFLYVGRWEQKKNTSSLIQAFNEFLKTNQPNYKLVLVGRPGFGFEHVQKKITEYSLEKKILFLDWQPVENLVILYNATAAFVFPSTYEGFGLPILEAMKSGSPVITSNLGAMKEIADEAALLVNPADISAIAQAMSRIANNYSMRQKLIEGGFKQAASFSWEKSAKLTLEILKK
jgi:glycosyltransferase involved in cell wall biosynthesis